MHTTHALKEISEYCLNELGAKVALLGRSQTDSLKSRFGQYRQLAGGKYDISLRQVYECEKKTSLLSVLRLKINDAKISLSDFSMSWDQYESTTFPNCIPIPVTISKDVIVSSVSIPVITYVGGYCCFTINKQLKCDACNLRIVSNNDAMKIVSIILQLKASTEAACYNLLLTLHMLCLKATSWFKRLRSVTNCRDLIRSVYLQLIQLWLY